MAKLLWLYWDPQRELFTLPYIDRPVMWYGVIFVLGFILAYAVITYVLTYRARRDNISSLKPHELAIRATDKLCWWVIGGAIIGARLGHVFFYDWPMYKSHPLSIIKVWEGGLASHGAVVGILIALWCSVPTLKKYFPKLNFLGVLDLVALSSGLTGFCIRIGNFINQEVVGTPTQLPWGVIFGHPFDVGTIEPRHPVQLYEASIYLLIFIFLFTMWKRSKDTLPVGRISGWLFTLLFSARFILDFWKAPQSAVINESFLQMGQILSLPLIALGLWLLWKTREQKKDKDTKDIKDTKDNDTVSHRPCL